MSHLYPLIAVEKNCYRIDDGMTLTDEDIISAAVWLCAMKVKKRTKILESPDAVKNYLRLHLGSERNENFWCMYLDNRHRVISHESVFHGTIDSASVYPRVIVANALEHNAAAVIFAHNHPSGVAEPSRADVDLTARLKKALGIIDIRVLDHLIVGADHIVSLAERGEL